MGLPSDAEDASKEIHHHAKVCRSCADSLGLISVHCSVGMRLWSSWCDLADRMIQEQIDKDAEDL